MEAGTLGAVVQDQNGNQYILSAAHAIAVAESINVPSGYLPSFSNVPITQPSADEYAAEQQIRTCAGVASLVSTPMPTPSIQVGTLGIVVPPSFAKGSAIPAEVALAAVVPGTVSPNILGIPAFSGTPMTMVKKGVNVQKSGEMTGLTFGTVTKMNMMYPVSFCAEAPNSFSKNCPMKPATLLSVFQIKGISGKPFSNFGDSGALILTNPAAGMCPQPVGMLEAGSGKTTIAAPISASSPEGVLELLDFASGTNTYSIVPSTTSCTPTKMAYVTDTTTQATTLQDITVPDPDVAAAISVLPGFEQSLPPCAYLSICVLGTCDPDVQAVGIDLSGKVAALDVELVNPDPINWCIPAQYGGVPVEQEVVDTEYGDPGDMNAVSF